MSKYSDFLTMKVIERNRFNEKGSSDFFDLHVFQGTKYVKNLNVRTKVDLIAGIETLASMFNLKKAELVTEILESALAEARDKLEKDGGIDDYMHGYLNNMESNYGFKVERDENGLPLSLVFDEDKEGDDK